MKDHAIAYVGAGIISLLLFTTIFGFVSNSKNKRNLRAELERTESLQAENLMVKGVLDKLRTDYAALQIRSDSANQRIAENETDLSDRDRRIASLSRSGAAALNRSREEVEQLQTEKSGLEQNIADLKKENENMGAQNENLQTSIENLEAQRNDVTSRFENSVTYDADNFAAYASRGKNQEKLTIKARCAKRLNVNFDVPQNLTDPVIFQIVTPSGATINPEDKGISLTFSDPKNLTAGLTGSGIQGQTGRKVDLKYTAEEKLAKGEYQIRLISNNINIGNCRLLLK